MKKPPPKAVKEKRKRGKRDMRALASLETRRKARSPERRELRVQALQFYISTVYEPDVAEMSRTPPWAGEVSLDLLYKWKSADGWKEKREEFQKNLFEQFARVAGSRIAKMYEGMLVKLDPLRQKMEEQIAELDFEVNERNFGKGELVKIYLKVLETQAKFTEQASKLLTPAPATPNGQALPPGQEALPSPEDDVLTPEEAHAAAMAIVRARRKAFEESQQQVVDVEPVKEEPPKKPEAAG